MQYPEKLYFFTINLPIYLQLNGSAKPIPPPRDHLRVEKDGRLINRVPVPAPQVPDRKLPQAQQIGQIVDPTPDQLDSIKKFQVSKLIFISKKSKIKMI